MLIDEWICYGKRIGRAGPFWCHLTVEGYAFDLLHAFAAKLGLKREWFQDHNVPELWHYDIGSERLREKALALGAVFVPIMEQARSEVRRMRRRKAAASHGS